MIYNIILCDASSIGEKMLEILNEASDFLWSYIVITLLVVCALFFTLRLGGVQFTMFLEMLHLLKHSGSGNSKNSPQSHHISSFRAFAVSLSSRVGTGNLAGVSSAIFIGGPGAVFWMWIMALLGSATAFVEATLAQLYKRKGTDAFYGGPAYYMTHGLRQRWMGVLFAILITLTFGIANQVVQSNTLCDSLSDTLGIDRLWVGITLAIATILIIFGGVQRIARFSAIVVPIMAVGYIILSLVIVAANINVLPDILRLIVSSAFGTDQAFGGLVGMAVLQGVKRGLFSNEAGEGSAPNAAAIADISHPVKQGLLQALGVFTDTIIICSCTAFIILIAGQYNGDADGIILTSISLETVIGPAGKYFLTLAIFLFAYSTIIANYFYGETNIRFATSSSKAVMAFRIFTGFTILVGSLVSLQTAWSCVDICMGLMTICNLIAIFILSPKVLSLLRDYRQQRRDGLDPEYHHKGKDDGVECWQ